MEIKWYKPALDQLDKALDFILEKGFISYAAELEENIISKVEGLINNYSIYPVDKYKKTMMGATMHSRLMSIGYHIELKIPR